MPTIGELTPGSRYKRKSDTPHSFHIKENSVQPSLWTFSSVYGGVWVGNDTIARFDTNEEVELVTEQNTWKGRRKTPPAGEDVLNHLNARDWKEHGALTRDIQVFYLTTNIDLQVLLAQLVASGKILRERRPVGRKMCLCYKIK